MNSTIKVPDPFPLLGWLGAIEWMRAPKNPEEFRIRAVWDDDVYYMRKAVREQRCEDE